MWARVRGPVGHLSTGILSGACLALGYWPGAAVFTTACMWRQTVGYWQKRDKVSKDMQEHIVGLAVSFVAVSLGELVLSWVR